MSLRTDSGLPTTPGPAEAFRVGMPSDPWRLVPWEYAEQGRFAGRWDDPEGTYRVLYAASDRLGAWLEVLAPFRPPPETLAAGDAVAGDPRDVGYDTVAAGVVPRSFFEARGVGSARLAGRFVEVLDAETIASLRRRMAARLVHYGLDDLDGAVLRAVAPRALTQEIGRLLYGEEVDGAPVAGVCYESRHGAGLGLWAVFERASDDVEALGVEPVDIDGDDALQEALRIHGLSVA